MMRGNFLSPFKGGMDMRTNPRKVATSLLGCTALFAVGFASANDDLDVCRAGYKELLMTPGECRGFLRELRAAQARADHMTALDLQEWHTQLLYERSQACPCRSKPATMRRVGMVSNYQSQPVYSTRY